MARDWRGAHPRRRVGVEMLGAGGQAPWKAWLLIGPPGGVRLMNGIFTRILIGVLAAVTTMALASVARADPEMSAADRYYFSRLEAQNVNHYNSAKPSWWRVTDPVAAIDTGHWLCDRIGIYGNASNNPASELVARSRVSQWGFVWSSPDATDEYIGATGIMIAAMDAYCPQYYQQ